MEEASLEALTRNVEADLNNDIPSETQRRPATQLSGDGKWLMIIVRLLNCLQKFSGIFFFSSVSRGPVAILPC